MFLIDILLPLKDERANPFPRNFTTGLHSI
jgi:hypothetical protein